MIRRRKSAAGAFLVSIAFLLLSACSSPALVPAPAANAGELRAIFAARSLVDHLEAMQDIADAAGGNRAAGTSGYEESARYVEERLRAVGYVPVRQVFTYWDKDSDTEVETFNILADT